jgi:hypothetical protein
MAGQATADGDEDDNGGPIEVTSAQTVEDSQETPTAGRIGCRDTLQHAALALLQRVDEHADGDPGVVRSLVDPFARLRTALMGRFAASSSTDGLQQLRDTKQSQFSPCRVVTKAPAGCRSLRRRAGRRVLFGASSPVSRRRESRSRSSSAFARLARTSRAPRAAAQSIASPECHSLERPIGICGVRQPACSGKGRHPANSTQPPRSRSEPNFRSV